MGYQPPFEMTQDIERLLLETVELVGELKAQPGAHSQPWLHRRLRIRTIHSSLAIEGNGLDESQVESVIEGKPVLGDPQDIREVQNAIRAYDALDSLDPLSLEDLLAAHKTMMSGLTKEAGRFRSGNVGVFDGDVLVHAGTPAAYVPDVMGDLFAWLGSTELHPLVASSVFHGEFEFAHPFADGNGRMGRLWQTLILARWREQFKWLPVESMILARQGAYYDALATLDSEGTCQEFVSFMLTAIKDSVAAQVRPASKQETRQAQALDIIRKNPEMRTPDLAAALGVSPRTAARIIGNLKAQGALEREGSNKTGRWLVK